MASSSISQLAAYSTGYSYQGSAQALAQAQAPSRLTYEVGQQFYNPGYSYVPLPYIPGLGVPGTPAPQPSAPAPASPTASASDLQVLIASIPVAQDGHLITAEYHNMLRAALVSIANRMGLGTISEEITITVAPNLLPSGATTPWDHDYGVAMKPAQATGNVFGWMEVELPDGARVKRMVAYGSNDAAGSLHVKLVRQQITNVATRLAMIDIEVTGTAGADKGVDGDVTMPGISAGAAAIEEYRVVNNREHKYLLVVELTGGVAAKAAQINTVQIVSGR